jgi:hypothetical protein
MKIEALVTTATLGDKGELVYALPGVIEVDADTGRAMIARGQARPVTAMRADERPKGEAVTVEREGDGPRVTRG